MDICTRQVMAGTSLVPIHIRSVCNYSLKDVRRSSLPSKVLVRIGGFQSPCPGRVSPALSRILEWANMRLKPTYETQIRISVTSALEKPNQDGPDLRPWRWLACPSPRSPATPTPMSPAWHCTWQRTPSSAGSSMALPGAQIRSHWELLKAKKPHPLVEIEREAYGRPLHLRL